MKAKILLGCLTGLLVIILASQFKIIQDFSQKLKPGPELVFKVGILHSLSGTMAISEKPVVAATLLALEEINSKGGLLGKKIVPVIADGKSDPDVFQKEAERLITQEKVKVIFGCWTSASRKAVKPVVEKYDKLLFYPVQYEGVETSPNIIYLGAAPNQQLIPAIHWARDHLGKRFFLVGSDYIYPHIAFDIAKHAIRFVDGEVVGETYVPLGGENFKEIAEQIKKTKPDILLNTINGESNIAFFAALHEAEISSADVSIMSFSLTANEIQVIRDHFEKLHPGESEHFFKLHICGTYSCWNYFESIDNPLNKEFVAKFKKRHGEDFWVTDPVEAAYFGVHLWGKAVQETGDIDHTREILNHLKQVSIPAPEGILTIADNHHAQKTPRVSRINEKGNFDILWTSEHPIAPTPYPLFKPKAYWQNLMDTLHQKWNRQWSAPETSEDAGDAS